VTRPKDLTEDEARELLARSGAMMSGHFQLSSGRHSDAYVEKARVLEHPDLTMRFAGAIASWYQGVDVVVAPAVGAVALGFAVALAAGARSVFAEREDGAMRLRRGFTLGASDRVLVVEDVITTGASAREVVALVEGTGAELAGVAALIDRSTEPVDLPLRAVLRVAATTWDPSECPMCRSGIPLIAPGSRYLAGGARVASTTQGEPSPRG